MTDKEMNRAQRSGQPSRQRLACRKAKLKMRYGKSAETLLAEIKRTEEKLKLLRDLHYYTL